MSEKKSVKKVHKPASNQPHINVDFYYEGKQRGINIKEM